MRDSTNLTPVSRALVAIRDAPVSVGCKAYLAILLSYADFTTLDGARPSRGAVVDALGVTLKTVDRYRAEAIASGMVEATAVEGGPTEYRIVLDSGGRVTDDARHERRASQVTRGARHERPGGRVTGDAHTRASTRANTKSSSCAGSASLTTRVTDDAPPQNGEALIDALPGEPVEVDLLRAEIGQRLAEAAGMGSSSPRDIEAGQIVRAIRFGLDHRDPHADPRDWGGDGDGPTDEQAREFVEAAMEIARGATDGDTGQRRVRRIVGLSVAMLLDARLDGEPPKQHEPIERMSWRDRERLDEDERLRRRFCSPAPEASSPASERTQTAREPSNGSNAVERILRPLAKNPNGDLK